MASKRKRDARKRFREEHPELAKGPTPPNPNKKKKESKGKFKRKKAPIGGDNPTKNIHRKHPLRVPGMKPGDSCFICKAANHIAKLCPEKAQWDKHKICLYCRQRGHIIKNCLNKKDNGVAEKICYNCGETGHSLSSCPRPLEDGGTKFARCFICNGTGHLSKDCPENTHGIYPKGGSCKICGGVTHLAKDCPNKANRDSMANDGAFHSWKESERPRGKVTKFSSGDDLEDDFSFIDEKHGDTKDKSADVVVSASYSQETTVKSKKQGPKVVNFVG